MDLYSILQDYRLYQTMKGAVDLAAARGSHPEAEIDRVTTPGGITIRGLNAMEEQGVHACFYLLPVVLTSGPVFIVSPATAKPLSPIFALSTSNRTPKED